MPEDNTTFLEGLGQNAATNAAGGIIGAGMGLLLEKHNDKRQLKQQGKLQALQIQGQKEMGMFNYDQQMKMWHETNYGAQMDELEKAGLNPGLLYGMKGGGGITTGSPGTSAVEGGQAPKGGQEAMGLMMENMQLGLMAAQKKKLEAEANNINADTPNKPLTGANIQANTDLTKIQTRWDTVRAEIAEQTKWEAMGTIIQELNKITLEVQNQVVTNKITRDTAESQIKLAKQQAIGAAIENELKDAQIGKTKAEIDQISAAIQQKWTEINQQGRNLDIQEFRAVMEANSPELGKIAGSMINSMKRKLDEIMELDTDYVRPNKPTIKH